MYDIMNILEALCIVRRKAKSTYEWLGLTQVRALGAFKTTFARGEG